MRSFSTFAFCAMSGLLTFANASDIGNFALNKRAPPFASVRAYISECSPRQEKIIERALAG